MTKAELRREMRLRLQNLGAARMEKSQAICAAVSAHAAFVQGRQIALFSPLPSEPDLNGLWDSRVSAEIGERAGARPSGMERRGFCYPRVAGERIEFVEIARLDDLVQAAWNPWVREPSSSVVHIVAPGEIDLVLVPGLAFTRDGWRLGRGGGFYDRFLAQLPAGTPKLGVCFDLQLVETLPTEPHDLRLDFIVTESGVVGPLR